MGVTQTLCWRMPLPLASWQGWLITAGLAAYITALLLLLRRLIIHGRAWWTFFVSLVFVSPVPLVVIGWAVEHRSPLLLLDPRRQSWAAMFGDVALAALLGWCAHAWQYMSLEAQVHYKRTAKSWPGHSWRPNWMLVALFIGLVLAAAFRWSEAGVYDLARYMSYTKLFHDYASYIVLATMVIFALYPVLRQRLTEVSLWRSAGIKLLALALALVWAGGLYHDSKGLNIGDLHPKSPSAEQLDPHPTDVLARNACKVPGR